MMLIFNQSMTSRRIGGKILDPAVGGGGSGGSREERFWSQVSSEALKDDPSTPGGTGS